MQLGYSSVANAFTGATRQLFVLQKDSRSGRKLPEVASDDVLKTRNWRQLLKIVDVGRPSHELAD